MENYKNASATAATIDCNNNNQKQTTTNDQNQFEKRITNECHERPPKIIFRFS